MRFLSNHWLFFLGWVLVLASLPACAAGAASTWKIEGYGMAPNFTDGQVVRVQQVPVSELHRGDVVLAQLPNGRTYFKRLIAMPGESIEIHDGRIFVNNLALMEPYKALPPSYTQRLLTLGKDEYYVLGDNRDASYDSHSFGPIPGESIKGRVVSEPAP